MSPELRVVPVRPEHVPELASICFHAFGTLQDRHGVERDFDSPETAEMLIRMFASRPDYAGFTAILADRPVGSNFLGFSDAVAGIGPITIHPDTQASGIGRALMLAVMNEASRRGIPQVRLLQEAINTTSLSLYTKLGFEWREACALMRPAPAAADDPRIRPAVPDDLPHIERISASQYHASRRNEVAWMISAGLPAFVMTSAEQPVGYYLPGLLGHGFADRPENLASLVTHAARHTPAPFHRALVPLSESELHRSLLLRGCRTIKLFNAMSIGPYSQPTGAWMPSIGM